MTLSAVVGRARTHCSIGRTKICVFVFYRIWLVWFCNKYPLPSLVPLRPPATNETENATNETETQTLVLDNLGGRISPKYSSSISRERVMSMSTTGMR